MTITAPAAYRAAAEVVAGLVTRIEPAAWSGPGLGEWDLRALVGHTSRALVTVLTYLEQPADTEDVTSPEGYYALVARHPVDVAAVTERGRRAGADLGERPAPAVRALVDRAVAAVDAADPDELITTLAGGMRVSAYLPTRTFELVVHGLDIAAATGLDAGFGAPELAHVSGLAAGIAVELGHGPELLRALTGRSPLADGFTVVP